MTPRSVRTVRIDDELWEGLEAVRERDGVQVSEQIRRAIKAWLAEKGVGQKPERKRAVTRKRS